VAQKLIHHAAMEIRAEDKGENEPNLASGVRRLE
jgi:hypothetical protein